MNSLASSILSICCIVLPFANSAIAEPITVKVGVILPLTGEYGTWGQRVQQGLELGARDAAHKFEFKFQDEGDCDSKKTLTGAEALLSVEKVHIFFMGCLAGTKAAAPRISRSGGVMLSTGLLDEEVLKNGYPIINLATQLATESIFLGAHVAKSGVKRVALIRWPDAFGEEFARSMREELEKKGVEVPIDESSVTMGADFRSFISKLRQSKIDAIATNLGDAQIIALMRQLRESRAAMRVFSNYVVQTNTAPIAELNGVEYSYPINSADETPEKAAFDKRFTEKFGGEPSANSYFSYDGIIALDKALDSCGATDSKCILKTITSQPLKGVSGEATFLANGGNIRPYGIKKIVDGKFVWVER